MGKKYGLQWLAAMIQVISGEDLIPLANKLIMPLYNLTDLSDMSLMKGRSKSNPGHHDHILTNFTDLKDTAQEVLGMIQTKMGPTEYGKAYNTVRTEVQERRRARKYKRSIQVRFHFSWNTNPPSFPYYATLTEFQPDGRGPREGCEGEDQEAREDAGCEKRKV